MSYYCGEIIATILGSHSQPPLSDANFLSNYSYHLIIRRKKTIPETPGHFFRHSEDFFCSDFLLSCILL